MCTLQVFYAVVFTLIQHCYAKELPSFVRVCHRSDPNLIECLMTAAEDIKPYLAEGQPEYNIPSVEPLIIEDLLSESSAGLRIDATHAKTYGCSNYTVKTLQVNFEDHTYELDLELPLLRIEARYNISGKLVMMPVKGEGPMQANVTNCTSKTLLKGELYEKENKTYLRFTNMTVRVNVGGGNVKIENLFNGDKMINNVVNESVNKNLNLILEELMPMIELALASTFLKISNTIVQPYTYEQLFPV